MRIKNCADFYSALIAAPSAPWPCGYPIYFVMADGQPLSFKSARENMKEILDCLAYPEFLDEQWTPIAVETNWEDSELVCSHSGERIESAYAEKDETL